MKDLSSSFSGAVFDEVVAAYANDVLDGLLEDVGGLLVEGKYFALEGGKDHCSWVGIKKGLKMVDLV